MTVLQPSTPKEEALLKALTIALTAMSSAISHLEGSIVGSASKRFYGTAARDLAKIFRQAQIDISNILQNQEKAP